VFRTNGVEKMVIPVIGPSYFVYDKKKSSVSGGAK
jgi:hypothetical protein